MAREYADWLKKKREAQEESRAKAVFDPYTEVGAEPVMEATGPGAGAQVASGAGTVLGSLGSAAMTAGAVPSPASPWLLGGGLAATALGAGLGFLGGHLGEEDIRKGEEEYLAEKKDWLEGAHAYKKEYTKEQLEAEAEDEARRKMSSLYARMGG